MPLMFNSLLTAVGLAPSDIRLLRHKDQRAAKGRTPYELWRDAHDQFDWYQATQSLSNAPKLQAAFWASFVVTPRDETLFAGLYRVKSQRVLEEDRQMPHRDGVDRARSCHVYDLELEQRLGDLVGRLIIDWGSGERAWIQHADRRNKVVTELRRVFEEPAFPGFLRFISPLSKVNKLPRSWTEALRSAKGVYLLTCPESKEQYVGSATGSEGFLGRWQDYVETGHGGNVALKSRETSDYQVAILEVAGTSSTGEDILEMEARWKLKLQSREMGLNRN